MEMKPKERVIYDEWVYYGDEGAEIAVADLMSRDGLTETEVREDYTDTQIFEHAMDMRSFDYGEEMAALTAFFDGEKSDISSFENPIGGNPVIARGSVGRWDGTRTGMTVYDDLAAALDTSPSRFGGGNVFADCEIGKVWDENGHLFVHGAHHDGAVDVEIRQLTDAGAEAYETIRDAEDAWEPEPFAVAGKTYDGSDLSVAQAMRDLWDNPDLCPPPRYMEQAYGCPAEEWDAPEQPVAGRGVSLTAMAAESRAASQALADGGTHDEHVPDAR